MKIKTFIMLSLLFFTGFAYSQTAKEYYSIGIIKMLEGDYPASIDGFTKAIKKDKNYVDAYFNRGICFEKLKKYQEAINDYSVVVKLKPYMYQAFNNRGLLYFKTDKYEKAIADFSTSIRINPTYPFSFLYRANTYLKMNELGKAKADAEVVLDKLPNYIKAHSIIAKIAFIQKDYQTALEHYNFLCEKQSSKAENFLGRARVFNALNRNDEACVDYKKAIELESEDAKNEKPVSCK